MGTIDHPPNHVWAVCYRYKRASVTGTEQEMYLSRADAEAAIAALWREDADTPGTEIREVVVWSLDPASSAGLMGWTRYDVIWPGAASIGPPVPEDVEDDPDA